MDFNVGNVSRAFQVYQNQSRIADLNRQSNLRTAQVQADRVSLSTEAQRLFEAGLTRKEPPPASSHIKNIRPASFTPLQIQAAVQSAPAVAAQAVPKTGPQPAAARTPSTPARDQNEPVDRIPDLDLLDLLNFANAQDLDDTDKDAENPASRRGRRA
ncbi:hypothetical protein [Nitrospina watsonii]|uniref:Uncharacterized protein n=1 Tax=Nitrospina watsonii TaxID=1323948 RepID=A0ABN8VW42_9BACT|nr:hypothetical protein [Nitrospina watsonii]CAI2717405.1 conserved protein of unknown function [Nitrospina watsonii]